MKKLFTILFFVLMLTSFLTGQIWPPEGLSMPGAYNGWNNPPTVQALASGTQVTGGKVLLNTDLPLRRYVTLISVASSGGDIVGGAYEWLFTSGPTPPGNPWSNKWSNVNVSMNNIQTYTKEHPNNNSVVVTNGKYYSVRWADNGYNNTEAIWMETSAAPVSIPNVTNNFTALGTDVTVTITLSAAKSSEENVFVRYTTDGWVNDNFVQATGSGTSYTATIPGASVVLTCQFRVLTTTLDKSTMELLNANVDLANIAFNDNGLNFPFPVELTSFTASVRGKEVKLNWQTSTEVDNYGFNIERASSSTSPSQGWEKIGFVNGHGNSNSIKSYSFTDREVLNGIYSYRLKQIDADGNFEYSPTVEVTVNNLPAQFELSQNYPNPFNPSTIIKYTLPSKEFVQLRVFNVLGNEIATLVNEAQEAGNYTIEFNAAKINITTSGIYFYRLEAGSFVDSRKMTLVK